MRRQGKRHGMKMAASALPKNNCSLGLRGYWLPDVRPTSSKLSKGREPFKQLPVNLSSSSVCTFSTRNLAEGPPGILATLKDQMNHLSERTSRPTPRRLQQTIPNNNLGKANRRRTTCIDPAFSASQSIHSCCNSSGRRSQAQSRGACLYGPSWHPSYCAASRNEAVHSIMSVQSKTEQKITQSNASFQHCGTRNPRHS